MLCPPLVSPQVQHVMQIDVCKQGTDTSSLWYALFTTCHNTILKHACVEPLLDVPQHALIRNAVLNEFHQPLVVDGVTICQLDTPLNNPSENNPTEVEVVDPAHPLYGRRFLLVSLSHSHRGPRQALVTYQRDILLRIPVSATSLFPAPQRLSKTKVSFDAVSELLDLARQLGIFFEEGGPI
jgi:hypothetical protein